jgi:hypothetical protein
VLLFAPHSLGWRVELHMVRHFGAAVCHIMCKLQTFYYGVICCRLYAVLFAPRSFVAAVCTTSR